MGSPTTPPMFWINGVPVAVSTVLRHHVQRATHAGHHGQGHLRGASRQGPPMRVALPVSSVLRTDTGGRYSEALGMPTWPPVRIDRHGALFTHENRDAGRSGGPPTHKRATLMGGP